MNTATIEELSNHKAEKPVVAVLYGMEYPIYDIADEDGRILLMLSEHEAKLLPKHDDEKTDSNIGDQLPVDETGKYHIYRIDNSGASTKVLIHDQCGDEPGLED